MERVKNIIKKALSEKTATAIALGVVRKGEKPLLIALGKEEENGAEITKDTLFDIASLTKVVFTAPLVLKFAEKGMLSLKDSLNFYISGFPEEITLLSLLSHTSGIISWLPLYSEKCEGAPEKLQEVPEITLETAVERIKKCGIVRKPFQKVEYSCMNYILLAYILKKVSGEPLEKLAKEFFGEIGMENTMFNPPPEKPAVATENLKGTVHDENARALRGVSGNAGIFSSLSDLSKFSEMILNGGVSGEKKFLSRFSIKLMREVQTGNLRPRRTAGWIYGKDFGGAPDFASEDSIGHSGFTGTSMFFDFKGNIAIIILTNRVYYGRENKKHIRLRRILSNAVYGEIL